MRHFLMVSVLLCVVFSLSACATQSGDSVSRDDSTWENPPFYDRPPARVKADIAAVIGCTWHRTDDAEDVCIVPRSTFQVIALADEGRILTIDILLPREDEAAAAATLALFAKFYPNWKGYHDDDGAGWEAEGIAWVKDGFRGAAEYRYKKATRLPWGTVVLIQDMNYPAGRTGGEHISVILTGDIVARYYRFADEADGDPLWGEHIRHPKCTPPWPGRRKRPAYCGYTDADYDFDEP